MNLSELSTHQILAPLTIEQIEITLVALNSLYERQARKARRKEEARTKKTIIDLTKVQETIQLVGLSLNMKRGSLNEAVASSAGLGTVSQATNNTGHDGLSGTVGEETVSP
jgi:hypothetical protein